MPFPERPEDGSTTGLLPPRRRRSVCRADGDAAPADEEGGGLPVAHAAPGDEGSRRPCPLPRILLADDHEGFRAASRRFLERDFEVVGSFANGREAVEACAWLMPDVAVLDLSMPEMDGLEATRAIRREHPRVQVVLLSIHEGAAYEEAARAAGAAAWVSKRRMAGTLSAAIYAALEAGTDAD